MELNIHEIKEILPHRYPFLLIDRITDMEPGVYACGVKYVSANEPYFQGHFPEYPVMPGVLILEAMAQTGAVALLDQEENRGKLAMFGGVRNCRFKREVLPGEILELRCEIESMRGSIGFGNATAFVDGKIVAQAKLSFVIK